MVLDKIKRLVRRIKRHRRNKKLSKFCDNFYIANRLSPIVAMSDVFVHPLVYEVLRFRYYRDLIIQCISPSDFITNYTEVLVCGR